MMFDIRNLLREVTKNLVIKTIRNDTFCFGSSSTKSASQEKLHIIMSIIHRLLEKCFLRFIGTLRKSKSPLVQTVSL